MSATNIDFSERADDGLQYTVQRSHENDIKASMRESISKSKDEHVAEKARKHAEWFEKISKEGSRSAVTKYVIDGLKRIGNPVPEQVPTTSTGMIRRTRSLQDLRMSHDSFYKSRRYLEKDFLPLVWLNMYAYLSEPKNILDGNERYKDCTWLREFRTSSQTTRIFSFQPVNFTMALLKFKEAPDELIATLEQYNSDIRTRDLTEEMIKYALKDSHNPPIEDAFYFLLDKIVEAVDNPTAHDDGSAHASERISGLREAYGKFNDVPDAETSDNEPPASRSKVRDFLHNSIEKDDGAEASCK